MSTPKDNDIVLARRKAGYGNVSVHSELPAFKGWLPTYRDVGGGAVALMWDEGACIPMRYAEAEGREDCEPVLDAPKETP